MGGLPASHVLLPQDPQGNSLNIPRYCCSYCRWLLSLHTLYGLYVTSTTGKQAWQSKITIHRHFGLRRVCESFGVIHWVIHMYAATWPITLLFSWFNHHCIIQIQFLVGSIWILFNLPKSRRIAHFFWLKTLINPIYASLHIRFPVLGVQSQSVGEISILMGLIFEIHFCGSTHMSVRSFHSSCSWWNLMLLVTLTVVLVKSYEILSIAFCLGSNLNFCSVNPSFVIPFCMK